MDPRSKTMTSATSSDSDSTDAEPSILEQAEALADDSTVADAAPETSGIEETDDFFAEEESEAASSEAAVEDTEDQSAESTIEEEADTESLSEAEDAAATAVPDTTPAESDNAGADAEPDDTAVDDPDGEPEAAVTEDVDADIDPEEDDDLDDAASTTVDETAETEDTQADEDTNTDTDTPGETDATPADGDADETPGEADVDGETDSMTEIVDVTAPARVYLDFFGQIANLVDETKLFIDEDGWEICAVDPANVGMGRIPLSGDAFDTFSVSEGVLGIDLERNDIRKKIGMFDADEQVRLKLDPKTRKLHISGEQDGLEFTHALIDPDTIRQEPEIPDFDWHTTVTMESSDINRALKAVDMVTDYITLTSDQAMNKLAVHGQGDTDDVNLEFGPEDYFEADLGDSEAMYALEYMKDLNKAIPNGTDQEVTLEFSDEFPVRITYEWNDVGDESELMLAPRIQND